MKKGWGGVGTHRLQALQYGVDAFGRRGDCSLLLARALVVQLFAERGLVDGAVEGESLQGLQHGGRVTSLGGGLHNNTASWPRTGHRRCTVARAKERKERSTRLGWCACSDEEGSSSSGVFAALLPHTSIERGGGARKKEVRE